MCCKTNVVRFMRRRASGHALRPQIVMDFYDDRSTVVKELCKAGQLAPDDKATSASASRYPGS